MRKVVFVLGAAEALVLLILIGILVVGSSSSDPLGKAIGQGLGQLTAVPLLFCVLPGLALGFVNRWLPFALLLLLIAFPVAYIMWRIA